MAILRKGSRLIVVDGCQYRWRVRHRPTYDQEIFESPIILAVEPADGAGSKLVAILNQAHPRCVWELKPSPVTPSLVADSIRQGLTAGWNPQASGKPFVLGKSQKIQFNEKMVPTCHPQSGQ